MTTRRKAMSSWLNFCKQSPRPKTHHEHQKLLLLLRPLCFSLDCSVPSAICHVIFESQGAKNIDTHGTGSNVCTVFVVRALLSLWLSLSWGLLIVCCTVTAVGTEVVTASIHHVSLGSRRPHHRRTKLAKHLLIRHFFDGLPIVYLEPL